MKILIYEDNLSGHRLEYLHHFWEGAKLYPQNEYIFAVPKQFKDKKKLLHWSECSNASIRYFDNGNLSRLKSALNLLKIAKEEDVSEIKLSSLMALMPFIVFFPPKIKVSGIIYLIYLYRWRNSGFTKKMADVLKYLMFKFSKCIKNIYILNDEISAYKLNRIYKTNKFTYIPDPVFIEETKRIDIENNTVSDRQIFFHFGTLTGRKGTIEILKAIEKLSADESKNKTFIFAGKVLDDIKNDFYSKIKLLTERNIEIKVYDKFCDYDFIHALGRQSDCILAPYSNIECSSGLLAYAAYWEKPIVVPAKGLIGKLAKKYGYGIPIKDQFCDSIYKVLSTFTPIRPDTNLCQAYIRKNSIEKFQRIFMRF